MNIFRLYNSKRKEKKLVEQLNIPQDNLDKHLHIKEAARWICKAQDSGKDHGVSWGIRSDESFLPSYPETTGYIIPTFIRLSRYLNNKSYLDRAILMGNWLLDIQLDCGAVRGGVEDGSTPKPVIFNTGQVVYGLCHLYSATRKEKFLTAACKGANWMLENQSEDGAWRRGLSDFCLKIVNVYNVNCAIGLMSLSELTGDPRYLHAAQKSAHLAMRHQNEKGWFEKCCLDNPENPFLHTIAYTVEGLLEIGKFIEEKKLVSRAKIPAAHLLSIFNRIGYLPGRYRSDWTPSVKWCCLVGSAQVSVIWSKLYKITKEEKYKSGVLKINEYLMRHHDISSSNDLIRGGVTNCYPFDGKENRFCMPNWAAKYFIDALLESETL